MGRAQSERGRYPSHSAQGTEALFPAQGGQTSQQPGTHAAAVAAEGDKRVTEVATLRDERGIVHENARRLPVSLRRRAHLFQRCYEARMIELIADAHVVAQIRRPDEEHIHAVNRRDFLAVIHRLGCFDLRDRQEPVVR